MDTSLILAYLLGVGAAGAVLFSLLPYLSGDIKGERRKEALQVSRVRRTGTERVVDAASRRKQVSESLKDVEQRGKSNKLTLEARIARAGLEWTNRTFMIICAVSGAAFGLLVYLVQENIFMSIAAVLAGGFGVPNWIINHLGKRRIAKFVNEFPGAVDIIIRGVKAGLPLGDCLRIVASECSEPLRSEFRRVAEAQAVGLSVTEAVERMSDRVRIPETNFFAIVIAIQQKAGGNLSEALSNLSRVIRDRKRMKAKVQAVSSEAKTSAGIIGALPFLVGSFVYLTTPHYMEALWTTMPGRLACLGCLIWMSIGVLVMKKMINFEI